MNRYNGKQEDFSYIRYERTRVVIGYEPKELDNGLWEWYEVYLYKKQHSVIDFELVKKAILDDINAQTDENIISGMIWTPIGGSNPIPVWLSTENQFNFKSAYDLAVQTNGATLPVIFKMGEDIEGNPIYHTFETMEDANDFYLKAVAHINQCLNEGWQRKDSIDWTPYEAFFPSEERDNQE